MINTDKATVPIRWVLSPVPAAISRCNALTQTKAEAVRPRRDLQRYFKDIGCGFAFKYIKIYPLHLKHPMFANLV